MDWYFDIHGSQTICIHLAMVIPLLFFKHQHEVDVCVKCLLTFGKNICVTYRMNSNNSGD